MLSTASRGVGFVSFIVFSSLLLSPLSGLIDDDACRSGVEAIAWIALLWAVGDRHKQVYFGPEVVEIACTTCRFFDLHGTVRFDLHSHERNEGIGNMSRVETVGSQRHGEVVTAVTRAGYSVADTVQLLAAHGAIGIAFFIGVTGDGHHWITDNRIKHVSLAQLASLVQEQTVAHVEMFRQITLVKANQIRHLLAFDVDKPQRLPASDRKSRILFSRDDPFLHDCPRYGITTHHQF